MDTPYAAAMSILSGLLAHDFLVGIYDPNVPFHWMRDDIAYEFGLTLALSDSVVIHHTAYDAYFGAHAVVIATDWDHFRTDELMYPQFQATDTQLYVARSGFDARRLHPSATANSHDQTDKGKRLDWPRIKKAMARPCFVFDGCNIVDPPKLEELGFAVKCIGNHYTTTRSIMIPGTVQL